ncbi:MAG: phosphate/phosphite/phosphonate ABC transporter substrate-binding protein [Chloroflexi bacterium]|nr:phosphate/phosphite/phosphonate ABC transporter substrate-binding protein [Chloroflexota bacterium]
MNHKAMLLIQVTLVVLLVVLAAGCSSGDDEPEIIIPDSPVPPTPRSQPLPIPTIEPPAGSSDRPVRLYIMLPEDTALDSLEALQAALSGSDPALVVEQADETTALRELCNGSLTAAWISPFTYAAALEQERCAGIVPVLAVVRTENDTDTVGRTAELIYNRRLNSFNAPSDLAYQLLCRSAQQDEFTRWVYPGLLLAQNGISPFSVIPVSNTTSASPPSLSGLVDYPTDAAMLQGLVDGECAAGALAPGDLDVAFEMLNAGREEADLIPSDAFGSIGEPVDVTLAGNTVLPEVEEAEEEDAGDGQLVFQPNVVPYELLVFAPGMVVTPEMRAEITTYFTTSSNAAESTQALLNATSFVPVTETSYVNFLALLQSARWDMALGR